MEGKNQSITYQKKLGAYRPHFQGKPATYYNLSGWEITCALMACFTVVMIVFWLCVGFYFWSQNVSTSSIVTTWSIVLLIFIPIFMIAAFLGSRGKAQIQQRLIKEALQKQTKMINRNKQKREDGENKQNSRMPDQEAASHLFLH